MASVFSCVVQMMMLILFTTLCVEARRKSYIVYMGKYSGTELAHLELLEQVIENRTPLILPRGSLRFESKLIVGVIDTGIWPEPNSFKSDNLSPPPAEWRGSCQNFTCNNKIIGAKSFYSGNETIPGGITSIDTKGHGTHVAATIAGVEVNNASYFGMAAGTARRGAPSVRIASYKVCWTSDCYGHDILAAFSEAIHDGVDMISISLGDYIAMDYFNDTISIGSFHAMQVGILTVTAAGNWGPGASSVVNVSPWLLSVTQRTTQTGGSKTRFSLAMEKCSL